MSTIDRSRTVLSPGESWSGPTNSWISSRVRSSAAPRRSRRRSARCSGFRAPLAKSVTTPGALRDYIETCLRTRSPQHTRALQDLVNHCGRLLGFQVEFGRYQGVVNETGHDGLWKSPSTGFAIVPEIKTTDAYTTSSGWSAVGDAGLRLLADLDAFYTEHCRCAELDGDVDDMTVWLACECGAVIARRVDDE